MRKDEQTGEKRYMLRRIRYSFQKVHFPRRTCKEIDIKTRNKNEKNKLYFCTNLQYETDNKLIRFRQRAICKIILFSFISYWPKISSNSTALHLLVIRHSTQLCESVPLPALHQLVLLHNSDTQLICTSVITRTSKDSFQSLCQQDKQSAHLCTCQQ
jgi:hypothetical protein